jgi:RNA polymerase sigma-70 factor (ECF subfamily)
MASFREDAFGRFYRENVGGVRAYVARLMSHSPDVEDLANDAFSKVLAASTDERPVPPKAYLFAAAHNLAMNHHRRAKVRGSVQALDEGSNAIADDAPGAERALIARQRLDLLWEALEQLPPRTRQIFVMRKIERLSNPEIAERLNLSVSSVEKHILKGLRTCQAYLDRREEGDDLPNDRNIDGEGWRHG